MNIFEKIQKMKLELLECDLKKTGENKFSHYKYYELGDIMPDIIRLCDKYKVCTMIDFESDRATLAAFNIEDSKEKSNECLKINTPIERLELKGANAIQLIGGMQTYMRRYLYMAMFDITENDTFDAESGKPEIKKLEPKKYCCEECGKEFEPFTDSKTNKWCGANIAYELTKKKYGKAICKECREKGSEENAK